MSRIFPASESLAEREAPFREAVDLFTKIPPTAALSKSQASSASVSKAQKGIAGAASMFGPVAAMQIVRNIGVRLGVTTKSAQIGSGFMTNDRKVVYNGKIRAMRQRILLWAKQNGKVLPAGFENRSASSIQGMFRGMARSGMFKNGRAK